MSGILVLLIRILLIVSLYAFLGWALYMLWRDLRNQGMLISSPNIPVLVLTLTGDETEDRVLERTFQQPEVIIGRSETNEFPISNETVSARHARLSYRHKHWWLEDLNSTNGTFLNDEPVSLPTVIASGDDLRVGQVNLQVEIRDRA
jgi:pSer/pThr/pTyr-binding forkhead associated (FHA) protein